MSNLESKREEEEEQEEEEVRIVIGKMRIGKSTLIRRITGDNTVSVGHGADGHTTVPAIYRNLNNHSNNRRIYYMDMPGCADEKRTIEQTGADIMQVLKQNKVRDVKIIWFCEDFQSR